MSLGQLLTRVLSLQLPSLCIPASRAFKTGSNTVVRLPGAGSRQLCAVRMPFYMARLPAAWSSSNRRVCDAGTTSPHPTHSQRTARGQPAQPHSSWGRMARRFPWHHSRFPTPAAAHGVAWQHSSACALTGLGRASQLASVVVAQRNHVVAPPPPFHRGHNMPASGQQWSVFWEHSSRT